MLGEGIADPANDGDVVWTKDGGADFVGDGSSLGAEDGGADFVGDGLSLGAEDGCADTNVMEDMDVTFWNAFTPVSFSSSTNTSPPSNWNGPIMTISFVIEGSVVS